MTRDEFHQWRIQHVALFPGILGFLQKTFGGQRELEEAFWKQWFELLQWCDVRLLSKASQVLATQGGDLRYEQHPSALLECVKILRQREDLMRERERRSGGVSCSRCKGVGVVVLQRGRYQTAYRCRCPAGDLMKSLALVPDDDNERYNTSGGGR